MTAWEPPPGVDLWSDTPGTSFTDKFGVLLLEAETHRHGPQGQAWVTFNDAATIAHHLRKAEQEATT